MNGISQPRATTTTTTNCSDYDNKNPDLLAHKYRPDCVDRVRCHFEQALALKRWIQEFINISNGIAMQQITDDESSSSSLDSTIEITIAKRCALITGPPGVGKTSLVYTVAKELNLHVVEAHSSERRDSKLFSMLKLTNQKGKINPIAKLFNVAANQQQQQPNTRRKRRKLLSSENQPPPCLSLSGDASIILFDDIDVVFEEDGPFLKSLVEFIQESKRPVVLTATQSIDHILDVLKVTELIHLNKPVIEDCAKLLEDICKHEKYHRLSKTSGCHTIASQYDCDIRQCLNRIHFYGDQADKEFDNNLNSYLILPEFSRLNPAGDSKTGESDSNKVVLDCYASSSLVDLMDAKFNLTDRSTLRELWLDGKPSLRNEEHSFDYELGEQIRDSIFELSRELHFNQLRTDRDSSKQEKILARLRGEFLDASYLVNNKIRSRIEPPEKDFFIDIVPLFAEMTDIETRHKESGNQANSGFSRRYRRAQTHLETIAVYLEADEPTTIAQILLKPDHLTSD